MESTNAVDQSLRLLRIIGVATLLSIASFAMVGEVVGPSSAADLGLVHQAMLVVAVATGAAAVFVRRMLAGKAEEILRLHPDDAVALGRWRAGQLVAFALAESVALYGLVLRFLGGSLRDASPFYGGAALLLLAFWPKRPQ